QTICLDAGRVVGPLQMKFSEFTQYQPKQNSNVVAFVCEDDFLVEESKPVWQRIFALDSPAFQTAVIEKYAVKEFEEIPSNRIMDDALTPSLFGQSRILLVTGAEKLTKGRIEDLASLQSVVNASLRIVLVTTARKSADAWSKLFPTIEIDKLK